MKTIDMDYLRSQLPVRFDGKLCEVNGIGEGKTIHLVVIKDEDKDKCPHCKKPIMTEISLLEHSPLFQDGIELLQIKNDK